MGALLPKKKEDQQLDERVVAYSSMVNILPAEGAMRATIRNLPSSLVKPVQGGKHIHLSTDPLLDSDTYSTSC